MTTVLPDFEKLKAGMKFAWTSGDFGQIASFTSKAAAEFVNGLGLRSGSRVLDVACGTGNTAIPAAQAGALVTGVDIAPNLLVQARQRAAADNLNIAFEEGDAEDLSFPAATFDAVITMFGAMFAPRPERVASELLRVCKPGGLIAMANWTPQGFIGKSFEITARMLPPPPWLPAPVLWGDEAAVRQRFSSGVSTLTTTPRKIWFHYPFSPAKTVEFFRQYFGPTQVAFSRLDPPGQASLASQMEELWSAHNTATDGTTKVEAEYLEVKAIRS